MSGTKVGLAEGDSLLRMQQLRRENGMRMGVRMTMLAVRRGIRRLLGRMEKKKRRRWRSGGVGRKWRMRRRKLAGTFIVWWTKPQGTAGCSSAVLVLGPVSTGRSQPAGRQHGAAQLPCSTSDGATGRCCWPPTRRRGGRPGTRGSQGMKEIAASISKRKACQSQVHELFTSCIDQSFCVKGWTMGEPRPPTVGKEPGRPA